MLNVLSLNKYLIQMFSFKTHYFKGIIVKLRNKINNRGNTESSKWNVIVFDASAEEMATRVEIWIHRSPVERILLR